MKLQHLYLLYTVVAFLLALGLLLAPQMMLGLYGIAGTSAADKLLAQLLGVHLLASGLITLFAKDISNAKSQQGMTLSFFIANAVGLIVAVAGTLSKATTPTGWLTVAIYLIFAVGFGYFRFIKTSE